MDREALILGNRILQIFDMLEQLRRLTILLFQHTPDDPALIDAWLEQAQFQAMESGFFASASLLERVRDDARRPEDLGLGWSNTLIDDPVARHHFYALRNLGKDIHSLRQRIPGIAWTYYQDACNVSMVYPALNAADVIPCDFDWKQYPTYLSAGPEANPERLIRWTPPNIDQAGEGLIISASDPVYLDEVYQGLWSIDVPVRVLLQQNFAEMPAVDGMVSFITDLDGNILMHPMLSAEIDREKGTIHHKTLSDIGGDFARLDLADCARQISGEFSLAGKEGARSRCHFQLVDAIGWVLFTSIPLSSVLELEDPASRIPLESSSQGSGSTDRASDSATRSRGSLSPGSPDDESLSEGSSPRPFASVSQLAGSVLDGKYRVETRLGSGGYGIVYRGTQLALERPVAIKILRPFFAYDNTDNVRRFHREGISTCRVQHPNAITLLDFGVTPGGLPYLVMELLEGHSLADELHQRLRLPVQRVVSVGATAARVLVTAHASGIVHRDIKPDNLFAHQAGGTEILKLLDFGLAKLLGGDDPALAALTSTGQLVGTPRYMAPEQVTGGAIEPRTDIYSLGITLYELLRGIPPFGRQKAGPVAIALQHLTQVPPPLSATVSNVPPALEALIIRMLSKDPQERPDASEVAETLETLAESSGAGSP